MKPRDEILKLLLESNITKDLSDMDMINRIVAVFEPIICERNELRQVKIASKNYIARNNEMKDSIRKLLDGGEVLEWMDES